MPRPALLVIDMLNDFILPGAPLEVKGGRDIIPAIKSEIKKARDAGIPVFYLCDSHDKDDKEFRYWPPHAVSGSSGGNIIEELSPKKGDIVIPKKTLSSFFETPLHAELRKRKIDKLILTGVCTNICVLYAAFDGMIRGYGVEIPESCVAGLSAADHKYALSQLTEVIKIAKKRK